MSASRWFAGAMVLVGFNAGWIGGVHAQTASEHFPNDDGGANVQAAGTMDLTLKVQGLGAPIKASAPLTVGENGTQVAVDASRQLCLAAIASAGMACDDPTCTFPIGASKSVTCSKGALGFSLTRLNTQVSFTIAPTGTTRIQALNCRTTSGNTHGDDLLERVFVRVDPNGVNGNVVFRVHHFQGGANPRTFTVNTTGMTDQAIHDAIASGYNNMGLGLTATTRSPSLCLLSAASETMTGWFVEVDYSATTLSTLLDFEVDGLRNGTIAGQRIVIETSGAPNPIASDCPVSDLTFASDKATMSWSFPTSCFLPAVYDVVRADLDCHCSTCPTCLSNDGAAALADATLPALNQGFYYLSRVSGGTWNAPPGGAQLLDFDATPLAPGCTP